MRARHGRTWGQRLVLMVNMVMITSALSLAWMLNVTYEQVASIDRVELGGTLTVAPSTEPGERVLNILLVGYDSSAGLDPDDPIQIDRQGERLGDVTIILHIDERAGTAALLSIPRDLWIPVEGYGDRKFNFAFGTGGETLLIETIEEQFDIPIHHFMSVDFAGFKGIVEAVDHVDVFFEQPARDWNSVDNVSQTGFQMLETGCQPLDPPTALAYVRSRWYQIQDEDGVWVDSWPPQDIGRVQRQQDFMYRMIKRAIAAGARNPFTLAELIEVSLDQITIDQELSPQLILDLGSTYRSFDPGELDTYSFPTDNARVNTLSVLLPLHDQADAVLELFRGTPADDPATVFLTVVADPTNSAISAELRAGLEAADFVVSEVRSGTNDGGITLQYGEDGLGAAHLVEKSLRESGVVEPILFELIDGNPVFNLDHQGRSIVMVVGAAAGEPDDPAVELDDDVELAVETPAASDVPEASDETVAAPTPEEDADTAEAVVAEDAALLEDAELAEILAQERLQCG